MTYQDELINDIVKVKQSLYPLLSKLDRLEKSSAKSAVLKLQNCWKLLEDAQKEIEARGPDSHKVDSRIGDVP
jgi:hypothetical protein